MAPLMDVDDVAGNQSAKCTKRDFITTMQYTKPAADGANISMDDLGLQKPEYRDVRQMKVHDVRASEDSFRLDEHGFQYYKLPGIPGEGKVDFANNDDPNIKEVHYKGMGEWLAKQLGAKEAIVYNHIVRNDIWHPQKYSMTYRGPATRPHIDVSHAFAPKMFRIAWGALDRDNDELEGILQSGNWQALNLWRPLSTIKRDALAVLDTRSASLDEIFQNSHEREGGVVVESSWLTSGLGSKDSDSECKHKWYYMHEQQPDEIVVFKMFDGRPGVTSNGTPHTAVHIPGSEYEAARKSIELRAFVLY